MADHVVFFGAHPDDCEGFAGGLAQALIARGWRATFVVATDGSLSGGPPANPELAATRREEAARAAQVIGAELEMLGFADGYLSLAEGAAQAVTEALERLRPRLVVTHHERDYHRDHREISRLVRARIGPLQRMLFMEPLFGIAAQPDILLDITPYWPGKAAALAEHRTQNPDLMISQFAKWNAFRAVQFASRTADYAEGYCFPPDPMANPLPILQEAGRLRAL
jgi:LmbE family N-acetylglucosaminyl deacetylase